MRVHRAGEGAPYTGLKPAGRDLGPAIPAADRAIVSGTPDELVRLLTEVSGERLRAHFAALMGKKSYDPKDVAAGRAYVHAYVAFVHFVERLYGAAAHEAQGHFTEASAVMGHGQPR